MASDDSSLSDEYDDDYYFSEEYQSMDPELADDLSQVILCNGESALTYRQLSSIDGMDVFLRIKTNLPEEVAEAWGLCPNEPIILKLHVSCTHYRRGNKPTVAVFQCVADDLKNPRSSRAGNQLTKIIEAFISKYWSKVHNDSRDLFRDDDLSALLDMGFQLEDCQKALRESSNRQQAADMLLYQQQKQTSEMKSSRSFTMPKKDGSQQLPKSQTIQNMSNGRLTLIPSSTELGLCAKTLPPLRNGFLVQVMEYMSQRLPALNEYCVVCDEPHIFQNGAMLKPAVCSRELCVFAFGTLGVMADTADDIASGPEVIDLLVNLFHKSATCKRKEMVLDPFPTIIDPGKPKSLSFNAKKKDWVKLDKLVANFPKMSVLSRLDGLELKRKLDSYGPLCDPMLQWIIRSNRSHIVRLPPDRQLPFMHTPHQFLLLCSPPAKEAKFRTAKQQHGSSFALHGSPIENWHSILRNGLLVASGTKYQMNGAAYGKGIYLSPDASVSMTYSGMGRGLRRTPPVIPAAAPPGSVYRQQLLGQIRPPYVPGIPPGSMVFNPWNPRPAALAQTVSSQTAGYSLTQIPGPTVNVPGSGPLNILTSVAVQNQANFPRLESFDNTNILSFGMADDEMDSTSVDKPGLVGDVRSQQTVQPAAQQEVKSSSGITWKTLPLRKPSVQGQSSNASLCTGANSDPTNENKIGKQKRFLSTGQLSCIALCEVIESKESLTKHNGNIWVSNNPDHVCTRFLFVYEDGEVAECFDTTTASIIQRVREAIPYQPTKLSNIP